MPIAILRPAAVGAYDVWILTAGANKVVAVDPGDPVSHDDATTRIRDNGNGDRQAYTILAAGSPQIGIINSLALKERDDSAVAGACTLGMYVRVGGTDGVRQDITTGISGAYADHSITNPLKSGSISLVPEDIKYSDSNFQIVLEAVTIVTNNQVTSFWGELDYVPLAGGFVILIAQWLGPLVAVGLHEMPGIARALYLASRHEVLILPHEFQAAWRELREWRYSSSISYGF